MKRAVLALLPAALLAGCGDPALWARWQADRGVYHATRVARRAELKTGAEGARERAEAQWRFAAIAQAFPASRWGSPPARGPARDVALASALASLSLARLEVLAGDDERALALWRDALARWGGALPGVTITARAGAARALDRLGRYDEALEERLALARLDPLGDPDRSGPAPLVLAAPRLAAAELRDLGREDEAVAVLREADGRFASALARASRSDAPPIARALAEVRVSLGDAAGALAALRTTLEGLRAWEVPSRAVALAKVALEAGEPDSALTYARWAASVTNNRSVAGPALVVAARAWEAKGQTDSAFAAYDALFDRWTDPGLVAPEAHFHRASLLERLGKWDRARSEFVALTASAPTHPLAFRATLRVVRHHLGAGDFELGRLEGMNAVQRIEYLLGTNRDPDLQREAGLTRALLLQDLGFTARAESSLVDLWRRFPEDSATESAALRGASLAEHRSGGRAAAAAIYDELARRAASSPVRRAAARRRAALDSADSRPQAENRP